jgi:hypothetical protein
VSSTAIFFNASAKLIKTKAGRSSGRPAFNNVASSRVISDKSVAFKVHPQIVLSAADAQA